MKTMISAASMAALLAMVGTSAMAQSADWRTDFSGPYIGVFAGYTDKNDDSKETLRFDRNLDGNFGDPVRTPAGADAFSPGFCDGAAKATTAADGCDGDSAGAQAGIRAGYDFQFGKLVLGVVGDYSAVWQEDSVTGFSSTPAAYVFSRNVDSMAAARLRAGFVAGPALIYGTGGVAYAKVENSFDTSNGANSFTETVDEDDADGWQAGGGIEYKLAPNLSVTGEYLYTSLEPGDYNIRVGQGTAPATNPFILAPNTTGTDMIRSNSKFGLHALNIGMSVRF
ncbi:outer membrane protein [Brevundimonas variabilis]|uniref:Outer membrane immunogenic protein n=1 Tax=Brevundimonas variabilis TaxID=74312 RepID=A0A7W9FCY6_9CAUL|nr:outer membrane beta-barrel protein [Brevundimonas variabilis]MBB5744702.1 outer membrane immunogenic protein [Brevundimonas variabilis]